MLKYGYHIIYLRNVAHRYKFHVSYFSFIFYILTDCPVPFFVPSRVAIMPQTRSQSQATISFPKKKLSRTLDKAKTSGDTKLELTNVQASCRSCVKILPLSPRKRLGKLSIIEVQLFAW